MPIVSWQGVGLQLVVGLEAQPVRAVLLPGQELWRELGGEVVLPERLNRNQIAAVPGKESVKKKLVRNYQVALSP